MIKNIDVGDLVRVTGDLTTGEKLFVVSHKTNLTFSMIEVSGMELIAQGVRKLWRSAWLRKQK